MGHIQTHLPSLNLHTMSYIVKYMFAKIITKTQFHYRVCVKKVNDSHGMWRAKAKCY